jgi:predicted phage gp36 major capsid-like protein
MIPLTLDPSILITSAGSVNPLRQLARTVQIATDSWNGVTSAGVTAHWLPEAQEVHRRLADAGSAVHLGA